MGEPTDGEERRRKIGSEDPTIHESAGAEGETLGPESAMDSIRAQRGDAVDPGVDIDEPSGGVSEAPSGPVALPESGRRRYTVRGEIARGGMGAIFKVRDEDLRRSLAMKVMLGNVAREPTGGSPFEPDRLARFLEEAQVTAQLAHPGVVPVHELGVDDTGRVFFTMSLVRGKTLSEIITLAREGRDGWDRARALQTLLRVCETVAFAHDKGVIHRDLKPANVMVGAFGEVYVMDWGLAKVRGQKDGHDIRLRPPDAPTSTHIRTDRTESASGSDSPIMTMDGAVVGTPCYMPPEQAKGQVEEVDERSDVYAIGAMLYQLLTGHPPYLEPGARISPRMLLARVLTGPPQAINEIAPNSAVELEAIAEKAMDRDRAARYASAEELADDLQRFLSGHVVRAHKTGALIELRKWIARNSAVAATAAAALVLLAAGTAYFTRSLADERDRAVDAETHAEERRVAAEDAQALAEAERDAKDRALVELERSLRTARMLALVGASAAAQGTDDMRSLILAREAVRLEERTETVSRLHEAAGQIVETLTLTGHGAQVWAAAFSPDGKRIVTASADATARIWDRSGSELSILRGHDDGVWSVAFSPDGSRIVTASDDGTARIWDLEGNELGALRGHDARIRSASFSPDGARIVTASDDGTARIWDLEGSEIAVLRGHENSVWSAAFSPDGAQIVTASADATARIWDLSGGETDVLRGHESVVASAAFSPTGTRIVTASVDKTARIWDLAGSGPTILLRHDDVLRSAAFSPDGTRIVTASYGRTAHIWDLVGNELNVLHGHEGPVYAAAFSPDGTRIVTASYDRTARIWDLTSSELPVLRGHENIVYTAVFSPDGARIVTASYDGTARIWDLTGRELVVLRGHEGAVETAAFSPDGTRIVTASIDETARIWDLSGAELSVLRGHEDSVWSAAFSPDGTRIVTASHDRTARIWDLSGTELAVLRGHERQVAKAAFSPDGTRIVTASSDKTARIWDLTGKELAALRGHDDVVRSAAFSPDGTRIVTTSHDRTARMWDLTGSVLVVLHGHEDPVFTAAFSPDGTRIVTASYDGTARIWDLAGSVLAVLRGHRGPPFSASFSPDGARIVTASLDGTARVWFTHTLELIAYAESRITRDLTAEEREQYADLLFDEEAETR